MLNFDQFKQQYLGQRIAYDLLVQIGAESNDTKYQCVSLLKQYLIDCFGFRVDYPGNAIDWWNHTNATILAHFFRINDNNIHKGDIVILNGVNGNVYGHIGIATGNQNDTMVEILEQNGATGNGTGTGGDAVRTRLVNKSRMAGLLRVIAPPAVVPPPAYTIEAIPEKVVVLNRTTNKWDCNYRTFDEMISHPLETQEPGYKFSTNAVYHHINGGSYYTTDINNSGGYNIVDCDDYVAPKVPSAADIQAPIQSPSTDVYTVVIDTPGFMTSNQAVNHDSQVSTVATGQYYTYAARYGMLNLTKTLGVPGSWINQDDNVIPPPVAPPAPAYVLTDWNATPVPNSPPLPTVKPPAVTVTIPTPVDVPSTPPVVAGWMASYLPYPDEKDPYSIYVANEDGWVTDLLTGNRKKQYTIGDQIPITGKLVKDGTVYARVYKRSPDSIKNDDKYWYVIEETIPPVKIKTLTFYDQLDLFITHLINMVLPGKNKH